jgi:hypothetical protein
MHGSQSLLLPVFHAAAPILKDEIHPAIVPICPSGCGHQVKDFTYVHVLTT